MLQWQDRYSTLLQELISIQGTSGDECAIHDFIRKYVEENQHNWKVKPEIHSEEELQDCLILKFGNDPSTAVFAHMDTIGFTVGYEKNLIKVGGPKTEDGYKLVGRDTEGDIETELLVIEDEDGRRSLNYVYDRVIERGTPLSFKPDFRENNEYIQSPYLDNRLGVLNALLLCETLEDGVIVFSSYEEHGGNSVGFTAKFIQEHFGVRQALISDITWVTDGVEHGKGVAISLRDSAIPRRKYIKRIVELAKQSGIPYQLEVESAGGSDGSMLQKSDLSFDWCFIGAPEDNVHSPDETVAKHDFLAMNALYGHLMKYL